jgi:TRAP-type uncharacterized transport system substrate-binding protein
MATSSSPPDEPGASQAPDAELNRRIKIMLQHTWLIVAAIVLLCGGFVAVAYHFSTQPTQLKIAVGPPNSEDARVVQALATQFARDRVDIRLNVEIVTGGPPAAAAAIDSGKADLAVVRRDTGMPKNGQVIAILRKNVVVFIVPSAPEPENAPARRAKGKAAAKAKSPEKIEKLEQMVGKRVGIVGRSPRNVELLKVILRQYNIAADKIVVLGSEDIAKPNAPGKIGVIQFDPNNVGSAIRESNVDVIMAVGPLGSPITADAIAAATRGKEPPTFLPITASEAIAEREPIYESSEIKAGAFGGSPSRPEESIETIEVHHYIVARKTLSEQIAADFTRHLFASRQALAAELPSAAKIEKPDTDKDAAVPVHPGAAAYIDGELKNFFDRYSDFLYLGLMAVSFLGSGLAGLLSYNKAGDRVRRLHTLERLLEIAKGARTAESIQALDELQAEIDAIQTQMIREVEASALDDTAMMAYTLSTERAEQAVSTRRAALHGQPPKPLAAVASL